MHSVRPTYKLSRPNLPVRPRVSLRPRGRSCRAGRHDTDARPTGTKTVGGEAGNGVFALMTLNVLVFLADKVLHVPHMTALYLHHSHPVWWQWVTHLFAHANLQHLSNNLFFLLVFGRFVEDTEGAGGVVAVYLLCGLGAGLASFLLSSRATVSVGASGAIFGLFATSVLLRLTSFNWRRLLESLVLGQFVVQQVLGEVKAQLGGGSLMAGGLKVSHLAHLGGALAGVLLVALLTRVPAPPNSTQLPP
ncbi:rhomboid-domain-containing protein [Haematococcus lacustris]